MFRNFVETLRHQKNPLTKVFACAVAVGFVVLPILIIGFLDYQRMDAGYESLAFSRRETVAHLTAELVKEKIDHLINLGVSLATRVQFRKFIHEGKWNDAFKIIANTPKDFPALERVSLISPAGVLMASSPDISDLIGRNFSERDWYGGVSQQWKPYISEVFRGATNQNSVVISVPILSDDDKVLGILNLQILTETVLKWIEGITIGAEGFVYLVDQKGHLVAHPKFSPKGDVVDFSSVPLVQKVLNGEGGIEVQYNEIEREERLAAYEPISGYGWGVVVTEPVKTAFIYQEEHARFLLKIYSILFIINLLLGLFTFSVFFALNKELKEKKHE